MSKIPTSDSASLGGDVRSFTAAERQKIPRWLSDFFSASADRYDSFMSIMDLNYAGIHAVTALPKLNEFIIVKNGEEDDHKLKTEIVTKRANLASSEIKAGHPTLNGFAVFTIWSWLESFVFDLAVLWIQHRPDVLADHNGRIKIDICDFMRLDERERAELIVEQIERESAGALKQGIGRFKSTLDPVGLIIEIDSQMNREVIEFQQVRNCIAHNFGIVDRKIMNKCPWMNLKIGERICITDEKFKKYSEIVSLILKEIADATARRLGIG